MDTPCAWYFSSRCAALSGLATPTTTRQRRCTSRRPAAATLAPTMPLPRNARPTGGLGAAQMGEPRE
jgi:hypothetical protein